MNRDLENLVRAYARLSHDVGSRINFACDLNNDDALVAAEREKAHLDQAFFVLSFAALESQVTSLACARLEGGERKNAMRQADFEKRWDAAVAIARQALAAGVAWEAAKPEVLSWYKIRSAVAHGQSPSTLADVATVLYQADKISATLEQVVRALD